MKKKPNACIGCPLYREQYPFGYVEDHIPTNCRLLVVYDNPSFGSHKRGFAGFCGESDYIHKRLRKLAGLDQSEIGFTHILRCRVMGRNKATVNALPKGEILKNATNSCRIYDRIPDTVEVVIAYGNHAWKLLSDHIGTQEQWRGYYTKRDVPKRPSHRLKKINTFGGTNLPVFTTWNYAQQMQAPIRHTVAQFDWARFGKFMRGEWDVNKPDVVIWARK